VCIVKSVGHSGQNDLVDVLIVQILLNLNLPRFPKPKPDNLKLDGRIGPITLKAIRKFETQVMKLRCSDGMIAPGDKTVQALLKGLPPGPSKEKLSIVMPRALPSSIDRYYDPLVTGMQTYHITKPLRMAHFLAQIGHETASLRYAEEIADGSAYEGRADLGNTQPGDGKRFKGRGLIQLTGRANYTEYSLDSGVDYVTDPRKVATDPFVAVDVACWFWNKRKLNTLADRDDVKAVTRRINGGYNGLDDRIAYLVRAKAVLRIV
jgi:putative chitinase